ncbi:MAG: DUF3861 domain-containing protein [Acetatifactor sp.]|nr:DUF3861 domain-containing protein [Acetatifactor sp.]
MKKRAAIILGIIIILIVFAVVWWNSPTSFLKSVNVDAVAVIYVRDGHTGSRFEVENREDIIYIVENIQKISFRKNGVSLFRMGTWFTLSFCDENGRKISEFIVNSDSDIRRDPFFYNAAAGNMDIVDYLSMLETASDEAVSK